MTGAWSPCGLSMVETLAPNGYARRLRTSLAACATFALGALAGGAVTFGGLALVGAALGAGGPAAAGAAAVVAVAAAVAEARGLRIAPQIRRQVPEAWRRVLPVPLAAAGYGVLLGPRLHDVRALVRGLGAGRRERRARRPGARRRDRASRSAPAARCRSICLAPFAGGERGGAITAAMCERPGDPARAAPRRRASRSPPARSRWEPRERAGARRAERRAAVRRQRLRPDRGRRGWSRGSGRAARRCCCAAAPPESCRARTRRSAAAGSRGARATRSSSPTPRRSGGASATRRPARACSRCRTRCWPGARATRPAPTGSGSSRPAARRARLLALPAPDELGRPGAARRAGCCATSPGRPAAALIAVDTATGAQELLRSEPGAQLTNPATDGRLLLYVRATGRAQELRLGPLAPAAPATTTRSCSSTPRSGRRDREREPGRQRHRHRGGGRSCRRAPRRASSTRSGRPRSRPTPPTSRGCARAAAPPGRADILRVPVATRG